MKKIFKKICAAVLCAAVAGVMSVTAAADIVFDMSTLYVEGDKDGVVTSSTTEMTAEGDISDIVYITATYQLPRELRTNEFWDNPNGTVSVEVRLETEGADVFACIPAFASTWLWVNPSSTPTLKYNEWITITESMQHFHEGFVVKRPDKLLLQVRGNIAGVTQENVKVSFRNFQINGVSLDDAIITTTIAPATTTTTTTPATTTTEATTTTTEATTTTPEPEESTTEPEETTTEPEETTTEPVESTESEPEEESTESIPEETTEPEDTTAEPEDTTTEPVETTTAPATTTQPDVIGGGEEETWEANQPATSIDYSQYVVKTDTSDATSAIVAIVIIAAVIVIAAVIGFIIYNKMKFY